MKAKIRSWKRDWKLVEGEVRGRVDLTNFWLGLNCAPPRDDDE